MQGPQLSLQEMARRLARSRTWHLYQAGRARMRRADGERDIEAHEHEAARCDELIRDLAMGAPPDDGAAA